MTDDATPPEPESLDDAMSAAAGRADLVAQLRQLEEFAARTASEGDSVPPQAREMIAHLREIVHALDGLTASMVERSPERDGSSPKASDAPERTESDGA